MATRKVVLYCSLFVLVQSGYPPIGDEVVPGSVLLPATRRGRYLANIVRRQAVDGTGIRFNKDADRINAEAKKKVDVLSEELLPYIIAEQERRAALHARVMSAVQNGEKGATVAEMRGKPPLLIRKGLMYRCPSNRAPKEPDGSGVIMCEGDIEPTPVMYDSCLSAEDKDLYVAENKYFFCNRHKVEGPDLPRNGSAVIGCAPIERTSLNYTATKCALEDTDDVVVHYRYYPDRTYKFVTELDPDHEVCDHWNPCQLGYIFSLPSPDQALPANELWHDYVDRFEEYERDEIVPPIAEDTPIEHVPLSLLQEGDSEYEVAPRYVKVPQGYKFDSVWRSKNPYSSPGGFNGQVNQKVPPSQVTTQMVDNGQAIIITLKIKPFRPRSFGPYYAVFVGDTRRDGKRQEKSVLFVELERTEISIEPKSMTVMPGAQQEPENLEYRCKKCRVAGIMVRTDEGAVQNLNPSRWRTLPDSDGVKHLQVDVSNARPNDFGFYMVRFYADSGEEHLIQALKMLMPGKDSSNMLHAKVLRMTSNVGDKVEGAITYVCTECDLTDVMCNGESSVSQGKVAIVTGAKTVSFNIASFTDNDACVYMGIYKKEENNYTKILAIFENAAPDVTVEAGDIKASPPKEGEEFQHSIHLKGDEGECTVPTKVSVNGIELDSGPTRRTSHSPIAYFQEVPGMGITISIEPFTSSYNGVYMGTFVCNGSKITKIVMELNSPDSDQDSASETRRMSGTGTVQPTEHILGVSSNGNVPSGQTTPAA